MNQRMLLLVLSFIAIAAPVRAQLLDAIALDTVKEYHSLEAALREPEKVFKLQLTQKKLGSSVPAVQAAA